MTTTTTEPIIEIVPHGQALAAESRTKSTHTTHYDVVCSRCGPIQTRVLYPSACKERIDHLCRPRVRRG